MFKSILAASALGLGLIGAASASTVTVDVDAMANSTGGGVGYATGVILTAGEAYTVSAALDDTWSLGSEDPCTRTSNADGLGNVCYPDYSQNGLTTDYGTLVGQINGGAFFIVGTAFNDVASDSGELLLFLFDSNAGDNSGSIAATITTADVAPVPLPAAGLLLLGGLGGLGALRRRKAA